MKTPNIQKESIVRDSLGRGLRDIRISLTDQCNLRCGYCMPAEIFGQGYTFLPKPDILTFSEIKQVVVAFAASGGKKVRLTGGEPLLRPDVAKLVRSLRSIDEIDEIALTTNGLLLSKCASELKIAGLNRVTISLDAIDDATFRKMSGRDISVQKVLDGIASAEDAGLDVKINAVIIRGQNEDQVIPLAEHFRNTPHILRYIEYMDVGNCNQWAPKDVYTARDILAEIEELHALEPLDANYTGEVASRYRYQDGSGEFGIISSVSQPFCRDCNRARLSADGKLYTCLFAEKGTDLKPILRNRGSVQDRLQEIWTSREDRYSELRGLVSSKKVEMSYIGG